MAHGCTPNEPKNPLPTTSKSIALQINSISTPRGGTVEIFKYILICGPTRTVTGLMTSAITSKKMTIAT